MTTSIRWVVAVPGSNGALELWRLSPSGLALEFNAKDRATAQHLLATNPRVLPTGAVLMSRLEYDAVRREPRLLRSPPPPPPRPPTR